MDEPKAACEKVNLKKKVALVSLFAITTCTFICCVSVFGFTRFSMTLCGSLVSLICLIMVLYCWFYYPKCSHRHPHQMFFYRCLCDLLFTCHNIFLLINRCSFRNNCKPFTFAICWISVSISYFCLLAAEAWYGASIYDAYLTLTNPFLSYKQRLVKFHWLIWIACFAIAIFIPLGFFVSTSFQASFQLSPDQICQQVQLFIPDIFARSYGSVNLHFWLVLACFLATVLVCAQVLICTVWRRCRPEIGRESIVLRQEVIRKMTLNAKVTHSYWLVIFILAIFEFSYLKTSPNEQVEQLSSSSLPYDGQHSTSVVFRDMFFHLIASGKGFFSTLVLFLNISSDLFSLGSVKSPRNVIDSNCNSDIVDNEKLGKGSSLSGPLQRELIYYTLSGIKKAILECEKRNFSDVEEDVEFHELLVGGVEEVNQRGSMESIYFETFTDEEFDYNQNTTTIQSEHSFFDIELERKSFNSILDLSPRFSQLRKTFLRNSGKQRDSYFRSETNSMTSSRVFIDYAPTEFQKVRSSFGIDDQIYLESFRSTTKEKISINSGGRSGAFMFYSGDMAYIVKSMSRSECKKLLSIVKNYANYVSVNRNTRLLKIFGCHRIKLFSQQFYFVVMSNIFYNGSRLSSNVPIIQECYDVKGSFVDRKAKLPVAGNLSTCWICNQEFIYEEPLDQIIDQSDGGTQICHYKHEPQIILKDDDLKQGLNINCSDGQLLYETLCQDSSFLCSLNIMDYSLLIGVSDDDGIRSSFFNELIHGMDKEIYYVGIIDILQEWDWKKKLENWFKVRILCKSPLGISAINPEDYKRRFQSKLDQIILGNCEIEISYS